MLYFFKENNNDGNNQDVDTKQTNTGAVYAFLYRYMQRNFIPVIASSNNDSPSCTFPLPDWVSFPRQIKTRRWSAFSSSILSLISKSKLLYSMVDILDLCSYHFFSCLAEGSLSYGSVRSTQHGRARTQALTLSHATKCYAKRSPKKFNKQNGLKHMDDPLNVDHRNCTLHVYVGYMFKHRVEL